MVLSIICKVYYKTKKNLILRFGLKNVEKYYVVLSKQGNKLQ